MCQLFVCAGREKRELNGLLEKFFEKCFVHKHGWGFADFTGDKAFVRRENIIACESGYLRELLGAPFEARNAFFHMRYATVGEVDLVNCHPLAATDLSGRHWHVIHNGTIFHNGKTGDYFKDQAGSTDTERLLLYLIDRINETGMRKGRVLTDEERFSVVDATLKETARGNKLNIVFHDGDLFYVHANSKTGSKLLGEEGRGDYLYEKKEFDESGHVTTRYFSTRKLANIGWDAVKLNTVTAYRDGEPVFEGTPHEYEYIERDEDMKLIYLGASGL